MTLEQSNLLDRVRQAVKERYLSPKTENAYVNHIGRFLEFHKDTDLSAGRAEKICAFLKHLQHDEHLSASTVNQARCAMLFFYREVLRQTLSERFDEIRRAPMAEKHAVIFTPEEVRALLANLRDAPFLIAALIYGSGLRVSEAVALRVGDIDFERRKITVRNSRSGKKDHVTILPQTLVPALQRHLVKVRFTYEDDLLPGFVNGAIVRRGGERAASDWSRRYVFPAAKLTNEDKTFYRHHLAESTVQKAVSEAIEKAKIFKPGCCQSLRYSFAARLFEQNYSVRTIHKLLGHKNLKTTMNYLNFNGIAENTVLSPLDA